MRGLIRHLPARAGATLWRVETVASSRTRAAAAAMVVTGALFATGSAAAEVASPMERPRAVVPPALLDSARANPSEVFDVIVQGRDRGAVTEAVGAARARARGKAVGIKRRFSVINAASAQLTGAELLELAAREDIAAISTDQPMAVVGDGNKNSSSTSCSDPCIFWQGMYWPQLSGSIPFMPKSGKNATPVPQAPAIAIVDSGIEAANLFFGNRIVKEVAFASIPPNSPGDGYGHGTFVAGLAAGHVGSFAGASPTSKIVSLDVVNDAGEAVMSDVIAAADWIYQNKETYGIRVANFSLTGTERSSFMFDPLDQALEKLWFSGVVVVAAAGNYGTGAEPSGVLYSPANDPFVITVGAVDMNYTVDGADDFVAPWSAWGYTPDGFAKPDLSAPGRYMIGTVPTAALMPTFRPDRLLTTGWMWMSGTSFAAPIVAGGAADVLAVHPGWTPDQVKGALMLKATPLRGPSWAGGVGQVRIDTAAAVTDPPNPNLALDQFLVPDPNGGPTPVFDADAWAAKASVDPLWATASWTTASWTTASWTTASWTTASWTTASWTTASWTTASWTTGVEETAVETTAAEPDGGSTDAEATTVESSPVEQGVNPALLWVE